MKLEWNDRRWDTDEFADAVDQVTLALRMLGLRGGHRVASLTSNTPLRAFLQAACQEQGYVFIPIAPTLHAGGKAAQLRQSKADAAITDDASLKSSITTKVPIIKCNARATRWDSLGRLELATPARADTTPAAVVFTSGTSGAPQAVDVGRDALVAHAAAAATRLPSGPDDSWLAVLPLHHIGGLALVDRCITGDLRMVLVDGFEAGPVYQLLHERAVTHASLVPTMLTRILALPGCTAPPQLRCLLVGGDRTTESLTEHALADEWPLYTTYGLTEACSQVATATPEESRQHPGTVGRPLDGVQVDIQDEDGSAVSDGGTGQIVVSGPTVTATGAVRTGDMGRLDADGFLYVSGRAANRIVTGGENVDPAEVEDALCKHDAVAEACVVGLNDTEWGNRVVAALVLHPGAEAAVADLEAHCRNRLSPHAVPKRFLVLKLIPKTPAGKVDHGLLRTWFQRHEGTTRAA